jgi:hypothetical protein
MVANALIFVGVLTGLLGALDGFILRDTQKKHLENRTIALWLLLDGALNGTFASFLRRRLVRAITVLDQMFA